MAGFQCPYCNMIMPISNDTLIKRKTGFESDNGIIWLRNGNGKECVSCLEISFYKCPNCN